MAHVFGDLLRQNFRCGRMPNSGQMQSGRGAMLCTACKTGAALHILPGSCTKRPPAFLLQKKQKKNRNEDFYVS